MWNWSDKRVKALVCVLIAMGVTVLYLAVNSVTLDADPYWHVALGKYIVQHKSIMKEDVFSWWGAEQGYIETAHSWLGSVILYVFSLLPCSIMTSFRLYTGMCCFVLVFLLLWFAPLLISSVKVDKKNVIYLCFVGFLAVFAITWHARPMSIGNILFYLVLLLLYDVWLHPETRRFLLIVPLVVLWANIHGGAWIVCMAVCLMFLVASVIPDFNAYGVVHKVVNRPLARKRFLFVCASCIFGGMVNPYGYKLFIYPFVTNSAALKSVVGEFKPPTLTLMSFAYAVMLLVIVFIIKGRVDFPFIYAAPIVGCTILTLQHLRIVNYLSIWLLLFLVTILPAIMASFEETPPDEMFVKTINGCVIVCLSAIIAFLAGYNYVGFKDRISQELLDAMDEYSVERMFSPYDTGGFLIYHGRQSFVDSRGDLFSDDDVCDIYTFLLRDMHDSEIQEYVDKYQFDSLLLPHTAIADYFETSPDWSRVYEDENWYLYVAE